MLRPNRTQNSAAAFQWVRGSFSAMGIQRNFQTESFQTKEESEGGLQAVLLSLPPTFLSSRAAYSTPFSIMLRARKGSSRNLRLLEALGSKWKNENIDYPSQSKL